MLLTRQLPLPSLIEFCRALRHNLGAGISIRRTFRQQAERGPVAVRPVAERIAQELDEGESLEATLKREKGVFPPLFISLVTVGEQTGSLPEVLHELEKYFMLQQRLWRQFLQQISWPMIQFILAPFVIAGMIFFLALLSSGGTPFDPLGFGLRGAGGALTFLLSYFGAFGLVIAAYFLLTRTLKQKAAVDDVLLRIPVIGPTLRALALMRFCIALRLTMNTGMPIASALRLSMRGTGNAAFTSREEIVREAVRSGDDLTKALGQAGVFPEDFLNIMANAEEGGRVPEVMQHQAEYYEEESSRRLTILSRAASWGVYFIIACILIFMIMRIAGSILGLYDPAHWGL